MSEYGERLKAVISNINTRQIKLKNKKIVRTLFGRKWKMKKEQSELLRLSRENLEWLKDNYNQIKKKHDNEWVVIQRKKVVATGSTYDQITKRIKEEDKKSAIIEFIDSNQLAMFF